MLNLTLWVTVAVALLSLTIDLVGHSKDGTKLLEESMEDARRNSNLILLALLVYSLFRIAFRPSTKALETNLANDVQEGHENHGQDLNNNECIPKGLFRSEIEWTFHKSAKSCPIGRIPAADVEPKAFWISTKGIPLEDFRFGVHCVSSHFSLLRHKQDDED